MNQNRLCLWLSLVITNSNSNFRCTVSLVISKMQRKWSTTASVLLFGDIVLLLLRDECPDIRQTMSQVVQHLRCEYISDEAVVIPSLAEEHFIDWLDKQFQRFNSETPWTVWMQLIEFQLDRNVTDNEEIVDEIFDKSEANVFGEVVLVCKKLMKKVQQSVTTSNLCAKKVEETLCSIEFDWPELYDCRELLREFE